MGYQHRQIRDGVGGDSSRPGHSISGLRISEREFLVQGGDDRRGYIVLEK